MFTRPRCRNFEPLVTTQLRLRNLIKITGINFHCDDDDRKFSLFFTLHLSAFSKPFYTSEIVDFRRKVDWPEINCEKVQTSAQKFICVRVWRRDNKRKTQRASSNDASADKMLFLWGVYFSGLVPTSSHDDKQFKENTLLFHLYDGSFTSPDQTICQPHNSIPETQSNCDHNSDKYSSNSNFSVANGSSTKLSPDLIAPSPPRSIASSSHSNDNGCMTVVDIMNESKYLRVRYVQLEFPKNEIQRSYTIDQLMQIQDMQRRIKMKQESSKMLADRICMKSAACLNLDLIMTKPVFYEPQKQPGMGRTLSRLLAQQPAPPKPEMILKVHEMRLKTECARFRIKLLTQERDRSRHINRSLEMKREKLKDENTEKETMIWNSLRTLSRDSLKVHQDKLLLQREVIGNVRQALSETKRILLKELNEIYNIKKNSRGQFTINGIHLPDAESYGDTTSTPTEISIALGYVAHAVLIVARILNIPLRNPIKHEGSRSKIVDNIKILPATDRIFPLFCRVTPPPNVLLYGVFLLNQNVSQIKHNLGLNKGDLRATLSNLIDIINSNDCEVFCKQFPEQSAEIISARQVDNSTSSVDSVSLNMPINIPTSLTSSSPRVSRSLNDFEELIDLRSNFNSSAPDLTSPEQTPQE